MELDFWMTFTVWLDLVSEDVIAVTVCTVLLLLYRHGSEMDVL